MKEAYCEREIEDVLETLERRGAWYAHCGEGLFEVCVPIDLLWTPFYETLAACESVDVVDSTAVMAAR